MLRNILHRLKEIIDTLFFGTKEIKCLEKSILENIKRLNADLKEDEKMEKEIIELLKKLCEK